MLKNFLSQLRDNPRLRWGMIMIVGIVWLYGILLLHEKLQEQASQLRATTLSVARLQAQVAQTEWLARVAPAKTLAVQLEARLWQAATPGLAQAALQDVLNAAMAKAGVTRPQITISVVEDAAPNASISTTPNTASNSQAPDTAALPGVWRVKAKLSYDASAPALLDFLGQLEKHEKQIVVGTLGVNKSQPNRVDMELFTYFQKPGGQEPQTPKPGLPS